MQQLAMISRKAAHQLRPGSDANQHGLVKRPQDLHDLSGLVQRQLEAAGPAFACLHAGRDIHHENPTVASGFGHGHWTIRVEEPTDEEQQEQGLSEEQQAWKKTTRSDLVFFHLHPQQQGWHFDALAPPLTQVDEDEKAQKREKRQG